jgi:toxin ParE1/3/4
LRPLRLSIAAERDLRIIFAASDEQFGETVAARYRRLVAAALNDLRVDAGRRGVETSESGARTYHLRHSRRSLPPGRTITRPRHLLAFRIADDEIIVLRVLHDAMDIPSWLSDL